MKKPSKQRAYQLRQKAKGLCALCPEPIWRPTSKLCERHRQAENAAAQQRRLRRIDAIRPAMVNPAPC